MLQNLKKLFNCNLEHSHTKKITSCKFTFNFTAYVGKCLIVYGFVAWLFLAFGHELSAILLEIFFILAM